jgi:DNA repair protein RadC
VAITDWPEGERPREKLLERGAGALSHAELLAVFLRTGIRGKSAVDLGRDLLGRFGSLGALFAATDNEIAALPGVGPAKCAQLRAAFELARRALEGDAREGEVLASPQAVRRYLQYTLAHRPHEVFAAVWLDAQHRVLEFQELFAGTLTQTSVYPREVVKHALGRNAAAVIFAHNHPSGVAEPSQSDRVLTETLKRALDLVDVKVLDHFVVGREAAMSFAERGLL